MTLSDYRSQPLWKASIDLAPALARLADELPAAEANGLSHSLRSLMIALPAAIASDQITHDSERHLVALKLISTLELIERVYPALDTSDIRNSTDAVAEQVLADKTSRPALPAVAEQSQSAEPAPASTSGSTAITVSPSGEAAVAPGTPPASVPILVETSGGTQESHVQPDSVQ